jgi:hypothetical protein
MVMSKNLIEFSKASKKELYVGLIVLWTGVIILPLNRLKYCFLPLDWKVLLRCFGTEKVFKYKYLNSQTSFIIKPEMLSSQTNLGVLSLLGTFFNIMVIIGTNGRK